MKDIIRLIAKYQFTLFFILLEIICFSLVVRKNDYQRAIFSQETAAVADRIATAASEARDYFRLRTINEELARENTALRNRLAAYATAADTLVADSVVTAVGTYRYYEAKVVNATYNRTRNYLTLNRGKRDGLRKEMAVSAPEGVVGLVQDVSERFAVVIPLINTHSIISAKIKKNDYYGPLQWDGADCSHSYLNDIPYHVDVNAGDTIVTSNYSSIFPEGIPIGVVESVEREDANFLKVRVRLAVDFRKLTHVYVIGNETREEQQQLEEANHYE